MAPSYDRKNQRWQEFLKYYRADHGKDPAIAFHSARAIDALDMLQSYLDQALGYKKEDFQNYLLSKVKNYQGLMGTYSFDSEGNADLGFELTTIKKEDAGNMQ